MHYPFSNGLLPCFKPYGLSDTLAITHYLWVSREFGQFRSNNVNKAVLVRTESSVFEIARIVAGCCDLQVQRMAFAKSGMPGCAWLLIFLCGFTPVLQKIKSLRVIVQRHHFIGGNTKSAVEFTHYTLIVVSSFRISLS